MEDKKMENEYVPDLSIYALFLKEEVKLFTSLDHIKEFV